MKKLLSALALVALAATAVAMSGLAWVGEWGTAPGRAIGATAINPNLVKIFTKNEQLCRNYPFKRIVFTNFDDAGLDSLNPNICEDAMSIGIRLADGNNFCGLYLVGFTKDSYDNVIMVMRFLGLNGRGTEYRLEIPMYGLTERDEIRAQNEDRFTFMQDDWYNYIGLDGSFDANIPFYFQWLDFLLKRNIHYKPVPQLLEGNENEAISYASKPVYFPIVAINQLRSVL